LDTIDIEDFAQKVKSSIVNYILAGVIAMPPFSKLVAIPILGRIIKTFIEIAAEIVAGKLGFAAFVINTGIFTRDQARDYVEALRRIDNLPEGVSDDEWEKHENEANHAFTNLVRYSG
jgi:hypothetical protein